MTCTCAQDLKKKLTGHLEDKVRSETGFQKVERGGFNHGIFLLLDSDSKAPFSIPFTLEYTRKAKSSGNVRTYKEETMVLPTFCPFCGKPYNGGEEGAGK